MQVRVAGDEEQHVPPATAKWIEQRLNRAIGQLREGRLIRARKLVDEVLERVPDQVDALRIAGDIARADGQLELALERYIAAAKQDPSHLKTLDAITKVAAATDQTGPAISALELAVLSDPSDGSRQRRLSQGYFTAGKIKESLGHARLATMLDPDDAEAFGLVGANLLHLEDREPALEALHRAFELDEEAVQPMVNAALGLDELGRTEEATALRERAARIAPDHPLVAFNTKDMAIATADDPRLSGLERRLEDPMLSVEGRVLAGLTLAKLWDDAGDTAAAARHLQEANRLRAEQLHRRGRSYDPAKAERVCATMRSAFSQERLSALPRQRDAAFPIVLFGMPRSGKTLVESRLSEDSALFAVGERPVIDPVHQALNERTGGRLPEGLDLLSSSDLDELGGMLDAEVAPPDGSFAFVSASPANNVAAGMFGLLDARTVVVHCTRDPRDLLLSNYLQWFPVQNPWSWTPEGLVHQYRLVETYARAWEQTFADGFVTVRYEDLVADPSATVDRIRAVAGLAPSDAAPRLLDADRVAASPTAKPDPAAPLHRAHVGLWQRWSAHVPELFEAIDAAGLPAHYERGTA